MNIKSIFLYYYVLRTNIDRFIYLISSGKSSEVSFQNKAEKGVLKDLSGSTFTTKGRDILAGRGKNTYNFQEIIYYLVIVLAKYPYLVIVLVKSYFLVTVSKLL